MRKWLLALVLAGAFLCIGWTWHRGPSHLLDWDAVTTNADGAPIPSTDVMSYVIYLKDMKTGAVTEYGLTTLTQLQVNLPREGRYLFGVQAVRTVMDGTNIIEELRSEIAWSDVPEVCLNNEDFGAMYHVAPGKPDNINRK